MSDDRLRHAEVFDDHDVLGRRGAQRDLRRGEVLRAPVPATVVCLPDLAALGQEGKQLVGRSGPERLTRLERQLERRRSEMGEQDMQVVGVEPRLLRPPAEHELRVMDHVLVDRGGRGDQDRDADIAPPPGAAHLLPGARDRARIAGQHGHVEASDVHPQLEGVGAHHPQHLALAQPALDRSTLGRQVPAPVAAQPRPRSEILAQSLAQVREHDLDRDPGTPEDDRLPPRPKERQRPTLGQRQRRAPGSGRAVEDRRIDQQQVLLAGRRAVAVDRPYRPAGQQLRQLARIADGCRAAHDHRPAAVVVAQAQQAPEDIGHVAAEHPAVRVQLIDHDHPQLLEQLEPLRVMGEDR